MNEREKQKKVNYFCFNKENIFCLKTIEIVSKHRFS